MSSVLQALHKHCSLPPEQKRYTLKDEASRFAYEAQIARDDNKLLLAEKLQFAAFALDPDNQKLFNFGIIANEKLTDLFPYWFAALQKIVRHPEWLKSYETSHDISERVINHIFCNQYELPESIRREYWNWLALHRHLWQTGDCIQKFRFVKKEFYPTNAEYLQAKENAWQALLSKNLPPQEMFKASEELFKYQNALPRHLRQMWTEKNAGLLHSRPGLEILAKSLECNAFLRTKACSVEAALAQYEELFSMLKNYADFKIDLSELVDYANVNTYIGLSKKVESAYKTSLENEK